MANSSASRLENHRASGDSRRPRPGRVVSGGRRGSTPLTSCLESDQRETERSEDMAYFSATVAPRTETGWTQPVDFSRCWLAALMADHSPDARAPAYRLVETWTLQTMQAPRRDGQSLTVALKPERGAPVAALLAFVAPGALVFSEQDGLCEADRWRVTYWAADRALRSGLIGDAYAIDEVLDDAAMVEIARRLGPPATQWVRACVEGLMNTYLVHKTANQHAARRLDHYHELWVTTRVPAPTA